MSFVMFVRFEREMALQSNVKCPFYLSDFDGNETGSTS